MTRYRKLRYDVVAERIVENKSGIKDKDKLKKSAKETIMRWCGDVDEKRVEEAVERAVEKLPTNKSKTVRKLDVLVSHK
ncbi:MAG: hypothetical protein OXC46_10815 [Thaumarchaeota archaeon]|nr:hypothetical protein [Nitrososphaerota archaeon]